MPSTARVSDIVETARPYVERVATDRKLQRNLRNAFGSAQKLYAGLPAESPARHAAVCVASDPEFRDELGAIVNELRSASERIRRPRSRRVRNRLFLLVLLGAFVLLNPMTGPPTRRWLKDRLFGHEQPLDYDYASG